MKINNYEKLVRPHSFLLSCRESDCFSGRGKEEGWRRDRDRDTRRQKEAMIDARERKVFHFTFLHDFIADKKHVYFIP